MSLRKIIALYLQLVLIAERSFLERPYDIETLHQFRVSLRQLRSILSFGKPLFNKVIFGECQSGLRQMGMELSYVRELDVLSAQWDEIQADNKQYLPELTQLTGFLNAEKVKSRKRLMAKLHQGRFTPVLLTLWQRLWESPWNYKRKSTLSTADFTEQRLVAWLKKFHKNWRNANLADEDSLHDLRIRGKKLRYVIDGLALHTKWDNKNVRIRLKTIQDHLGLLNDTYRSNVLLQKLLKRSNLPALHYEAGILTGWQIRQACQVQKQLQQYQEKSPFRKK